MRDPYQVLAVDRSADQPTIRKAFKKLARKYHPDVNQDAGAEDRFKQINAAYDVLGDEKKRKLWDEFGEASTRPGLCGGRAAGTKTTRSRRNADCATRAAWRCPTWTGSKDPPKSPIRRAPGVTPFPPGQRRSRWVTGRIRGVVVPAPGSGRSSGRRAPATDAHAQPASTTAPGLSGLLLGSWAPLRPVPGALPLAGANPEGQAGRQECEGGSQTA